MGLISTSLLSRHVVWYESHAEVLRQATYAEKFFRCFSPWLSLHASLFECGASGDSLTSVPFMVFAFGVFSFRVCLFGLCSFGVSLSCSVRVLFRVLFLFRVFRVPERWSKASDWA